MKYEVMYLGKEWTCDGWSGETASESVAEMLLREGKDPSSFTINDLVNVTPFHLRTGDHDKTFV